MSLRQSFRTARAQCELDGGDLATFNNKKEEDFFRKENYNGFRFGYRKFTLNQGNFYFKFLLRYIICNFN